MKGSQVRIDNVSKNFGSFQAVKNSTLEIHKGEFFSLLGPSGCGKTTLLRIIAGFEDPSGGTVYLDDTNVIPLPANKRHVNTVFQNYALFPHLSVFENVAFPLRLKKVSEKGIKERVDLLNDLGQQVHGCGKKKRSAVSGTGSAQNAHIFSVARSDLLPVRLPD